MTTRRSSAARRVRRLASNVAPYASVMDARRRIARPGNRVDRISEKDQKLLWGRAAARCSMPNCRQLLTADPESDGSLTLGDMCHIVASGSAGPRGKSPLSRTQRHSYANLILMCAHHHRLIDRAVKTYQVAALHLIKTNHEEWVAQSLSGSRTDPADLVYAAVVDTATVALQLDSWPWFVDNAVRDLLHVDFVDARRILNTMLLSALWPNRHPKLDQSAKAMIRAFSDFVTHFESGAELKQGGDVLGADRSYKRVLQPHEKYQEYVEAQTLWSTKSFALLCDYVVKLNRFADAVREYLNPMFYRLPGRFLVEDTMGVRNGLQPSLLLPSPAIVRRLQKAVEKKRRRRPAR